jgi:electron transport complex protein RnfE
MSLFKDFSKGVWKENPVLVLLLGTCPTLAVTSNAVNGLGMGVATACVLVASNAAISLLKNVVPAKIRIPCYIVIIAGLVSAVDPCMEAYAPSTVYNALGIFIPLIAVNCIVLGRAEAFASKHTVVRSIADGLGMGLGFTLILVMLGGVREFLTNGSLFEIKIITAWSTDFLLPASAPGAFIIMGCFLAVKNFFNIRRSARQGKIYIPPQGLSCRSCRLCKLGDD